MQHEYSQHFEMVPCMRAAGADPLTNNMGGWIGWRVTLQQRGDTGFRGEEVHLLPSVDENDPASKRKNEGNIFIGPQPNH